MQMTSSESSESPAAEMEVQVLSPMPPRRKMGGSYERIETASEDLETETGTWRGSVFLMFVVFGIASLTPWNMFITATAYFQSKFNGSSPDVEENFPNYFQTGAICVDVLVSFLAVPLVRFVPIPALIYTANSLMLAMFGLTAVLARMDSSAWAYQFFIITEVSFCAMCGGGALYISTMWAVTSSMHPMYIEGFLIGMTFAGIIASVLNIVTLSIPGIDFVGAGFWYFTVAALILTISLVLFAHFHCHHYQTPAKEMPGLKTHHSSMSQLTKDTFSQGYTIFFNLFLTFLLFPGVLSTLESRSTNPTWAVRYFKPVTLFLTFNLGDLAGRILARLVEFPGRALIPWYTTARSLFVLLLVMCNLQPRSVPVWFQDDLSPAVLIFLFAVCNGQILTLCLRYAPESGKSSRDKATIGTIMGFHGAIGRVGGSLATYLVFMLLK